MNQIFYQQLINIIEEKNIYVEEPLSRHTTFKIGGPADYLLTPSDSVQISKIIELCRRYELPFYVIGNGSNLLVSDKGYRGLIIKIAKNISKIEIDKEIDKNIEDDIHYKVRAGAGVMLCDLADEIAKNSLSGFEFASGIPGTLGGAITMNAGAYEGEISHCIDSAYLLDNEGDSLHLNKEELELGYRTSIIQKNNYTVVEAVFKFKKGNKDEILEKMIDLNNRRKEKQPLELPSAGSTFKRPKGYFAGKLIMDAGLRGYRVGDVMISDKHCGFVVNVGNATAKDVRRLIADVDKKVYDKFLVHLEPELKFLGEF